MQHYFKKKSDNNQIARARARPTQLDGLEISAFSYNAKKSNRVDSRRGGGEGSLGDVIKTERTSKPGASKIKKKIILGVILVVLVIIISLIYVSGNPKIIVIQPSGFSYLPRQLTVYKTAAARDLNSSIYNRNKLTLSSSNVASQLEKQFPEVQYAGVTISLLSSTPSVYLQLAKPEILYQTPNGEFALDSNGVVIDIATGFGASELSRLPLVETSAPAAINVGTQVIAGTNVSFILTVQAALAAKKISVTKYVLVPNAEQLNAYPANVNYYVKFNLNETDALLQTGTYLATIANLKQQGITPTTYVDVRVDGRAYYK